MSVAKATALDAMSQSKFVEPYQCESVRFGLEAGMCVAKSDVRFTPNSDRESGHQQKVMSALPPKADMCGATRDVCFGPIADMDCVKAY
jgi:hypothetical protein